MRDITITFAAPVVGDGPRYRARQPAVAAFWPTSGASVGANARMAAKSKECGLIAGILAGSIARFPSVRTLTSRPSRASLSFRQFSGTRNASPAAEHVPNDEWRISFYLLAPYVANEAMETLIDGKPPRTANKVQEPTPNSAMSVTSASASFGSCEAS